jgi:hypothetical protein
MSGWGVWIALGSLAVAAAAFYFNFLRRPRLEYHAYTVSTEYSEHRYGQMVFQVNIRNVGVRPARICGMRVKVVHSRGLGGNQLRGRLLTVDGRPFDLYRSVLAVPGRETRTIVFQVTTAKPVPKGNAGITDAVIEVDEGRRKSSSLTVGIGLFVPRLRFQIDVGKLYVAWSGSASYVDHLANQR